MTSRLRKTLDWTFGLGLIGLGIVGGFLPVVQGWIFVVAGLALLSSHSPLAKRLYDRFKGSIKKVREKIAERRSSAADQQDGPD